MSNTKIILLLALLLVLVGGGYWYTTTRDQEVACTLEAKVCPDGSTVGRVGPSCEFAQCPGEAADIDVGADLDVVEEGKG